MMTEHVVVDDVDDAGPRLIGVIELMELLMYMLGTGQGGCRWGRSRGRKRRRRVAKGPCAKELQCLCGPCIRLS